MRLRLLRYGVVLFGAFIVYAALTVAYNWDDQPFWSLRARITEENTRYAIIAHPADRWFFPVLVASLCTPGAALAAVVFETIRHFRKPAAE